METSLVGVDVTTLEINRVLKHPAEIPLVALSEHLHLALCSCVHGGELCRSTSQECQGVGFGIVLH